MADPPGPLSLLALQRAAGNAAATLAVQRMRGVDAPTSARHVPDKEKWALTAITNAKNAHLPAMPATWANVDRKENTSTSAGALHHKISKETLSDIARLLGPAATSKPGTTGREGAQAFWAACVKAAGAKVTADAARNPHRVLWNMTVNLSIGAPSPVGDPGIGFDPDTEEDTGNPGERRLDAVSGHLKNLEDTFRAAAGRPFTDEVWNTMATHLRNAVTDARHDGLTLAAPKTEQWLYDDETRQHQKKGLRSFPGVAGGTTLFQQARVQQQAIERFRDSQKVVATGQAGGTVGGAPVTVELTMTEADIYHICKRHTFEHFDFGDSKAVNSFWPPDFTFDKVKDVVSGVLPGIAAACLAEMTESTAPGEEVVRWVGSDFTRGNQQVLDRTLFFIAKIQDFDEDAGLFTGGVQTVAPDGKGARAFLGREIRQIGRTVAPPALAPAAPGPAVPVVPAAVTGEIKGAFTDRNVTDAAVVKKRAGGGHFGGGKVTKAVTAGEVVNGDHVMVGHHRMRVEVEPQPFGGPSVKLYPV